MKVWLSVLIEWKGMANMQEDNVGLSWYGEKVEGMGLNHAW